MSNNTTSIAEIRQAGKLVARQAGGRAVQAFFESHKATLQAVLPRHVSPDRMLKIALGALRTTPKLMNCTVESLMGAVVHCSQLGLEPNTPLGHAYLIPFENRRKGVTEVQIVLGYKGLVDLARRSGQIVSIAAHEVCVNDEFEFEYGLEEKLKHKPALGHRGDVIAFYAVAKLVGGGHAFEVMSAEQVDAIRDNSQNYKFAKDKKTTVWGQHYSEMGRKTVLRRLVKYLPVSIEMAQASTLDDFAESGRNQDLGTVLDGDYITEAVSDDDDVVDQSTGEILNQQNAAPQQPQHEPKRAAQQSAQQTIQQAQAIEFDYAGTLSQILKCEDVDALDLIADNLNDLPEGAERSKLQYAYRERREKLEEQS